MAEQMSHAIAGVLTCARIYSMELDREHFPDATPIRADIRILETGLPGARLSPLALFS